MASSAAATAAVGNSTFHTAPPSLPSSILNSTMPPTPSSSNRSTNLTRLWQRLPASFKRPRNLVIASSIPILASFYLANPANPFHQRIDALLAPIHTALFTYQHNHNQTRLFSSLRGETLDLSPNPSLNLTPSLPTNLVYSALVSNAWLLGGVAGVAEGCGYPVGVIAAGCGEAGEGLAKVASDSKDAVIANMLCSSKRGTMAVARGASEQLEAEPTAQKEEEWQSLLRECHRVLKPGGKLYIIDYTAQSASSHSIAAALQRLLSPLSRLALHNTSLDTPIAQHLLTQTANDWETVHLEHWPPHATAVPLSLTTTVDGQQRVEGLGSGVAVLVGGVCVKRKAGRLSEYVRGRETVMLDELFKYGTFNTTRQQPSQQQQQRR